MQGLPRDLARAGAWCRSTAAALAAVGPEAVPVVAPAEAQVADQAEGPAEGWADCLAAVVGAAVVDGAAVGDCSDSR